MNPIIKEKQRGRDVTERKIPYSPLTARLLNDKIYHKYPKIKLGW
jgi:hypothetical protein